MTRFGVILSNASIVGRSKKGDVLILEIVSSGITERAAKRGAKKEASKVIQFNNQEVVSISKASSGKIRDHYIVNISNGNF